MSKWKLKPKGNWKKYEEKINFLIYKDLSTNMEKYLFKNLFIYWPHHVTCGILVPQTGIEPRSLGVRAQSPNRWTTREFSKATSLQLNLKKEVGGEGGGDKNWDMSRRFWTYKLSN